MPQSNLTADYTLKPSELFDVLATLTEIRQPVMVWGPPGCAKSAVSVAVADATDREYIDVRALLLNPVDLLGVPVPDKKTKRTEWYSPEFLPASDSDSRFLINLEELVSAKPLVQASLYQLVLDRKLGEYTLPEGASLIACGNRASDRGVVHKMPTPLASRFVHVEVKVDVDDWLAWGAQHDVAAEVLFFIEMRRELLHVFDPTSDEPAFPCPRTWEFVSNIVKAGNLPSDVERSIMRGTIGEAAAVEFTGFLRFWRELPHPRVVLSDPENAKIPENASALVALCGSLYRVADDTNFDAIVAYAKRLRRELGEFLVGQCVKRDDSLQHSKGFIQWAAARTQ